MNKIIDFLFKHTSHIALGIIYLCITHLFELNIPKSLWVAGFILSLWAVYQKEKIC